MKYFNYSKLLFTSAAFCMFAACSDDNVSPDMPPSKESEAKYVGQAVGNFSAEEWYPGGKLGTTENTSSNCYEDNTPAIDEQGLTDLFLIKATSWQVPNTPLTLSHIKDGDQSLLVVLASIAILVATLTDIVAITWIQ